MTVPFGAGPQETPFWRCNTFHLSDRQSCCYQWSGDRRGFDDRGDLPGGYRRDAPDYVPGGYRRGDVDVRSYEEVRRARREYNDGGRLTIREPGRVIVRDNDRYFIHHDETERFRELDRDAGIAVELAERSEEHTSELQSH